MRRRMLQKWLTFGAAVVIVIAVALAAVKFSGEMGDFNREKQKSTEEVVEKNGYTLQPVEFTIVRKLNEDAFLVVKDGLAGMVNGKGEYLVEPVFTYTNYFDGEWISFQDEYNMGYVYDTKGKQLFTFNGTQTEITEDGIIYNIWTSYQKGIKTELIIGKEDTGYYGVRYYNAENGELICEFYSNKDWLDATAFPDKNGVAVAVIDEEAATTVYRITKDGYETETFDDTKGVSRRLYYTDYLHWAYNLLNDGWLKCGVSENKNGEEPSQGGIREALYNINTGETVYLPEKYQNTYAVYYDYEVPDNGSKGLYYGISTLTESEYYGKYPEEMKYAICCGNEILSEEIYTWMTFSDNYILAGNETLGHVLDYEGKVLKEFADISSDFVDGKLIVYSGVGVYMMDEKLDIDLDAIMKDAYYLGPGFVWDGTHGYMILQEE